MPLTVNFVTSFVTGDTSTLPCITGKSLCGNVAFQVTGTTAHVEVLTASPNSTEIFLRTGKPAM